MFHANDAEVYPILLKKRFTFDVEFEAELEQAFKSYENDNVPTFDVAPAFHVFDTAPAQQGVQQVPIFMLLRLARENKKI